MFSVRLKSLECLDARVMLACYIIICRNIVTIFSSDFEISVVKVVYCAKEINSLCINKICVIFTWFLNLFS